jgi:hypothetical protein
MNFDDLIAEYDPFYGHVPTPMLIDMLKADGLAPEVNLTARSGNHPLQYRYTNDNGRALYPLLREGLHVANTRIWRHLLATFAVQCNN